MFMCFFLVCHPVLKYIDEGKFFEDNLLKNISESILESLLIWPFFYNLLALSLLFIKIRGKRIKHLHCVHNLNIVSIWSPHDLFYSFLFQRLLVPFFKVLCQYNVLGVLYENAFFHDRVKKIKNFWKEKSEYFWIFLFYLGAYICIQAFLPEKR